MDDPTQTTIKPRLERVDDQHYVDAILAFELSGR
jgi:hypothetical protein